MQVVELMRRQRKIPRGVFASFVRGNAVLKHHCTVNKKFSTSNLKFTAAVRRSQRCLEFYCAEHPDELDDTPPLSRSAPLSLTDGTTEVSSSVVAECTEVLDQWDT